MKDQDEFIFRPDYISTRKFAIASVSLVAAIVFGLLYASGDNLFVITGANDDADDVFIVFGIFFALFLSILLAVVHSFGEKRRHKDIAYHVSGDGISIVYKGTEERHIHWSEVAEIRVAHGPCEPDSEYTSGPYGVYILLEYDVTNLYKAREQTLNLTFSPKNLRTIHEASIIKVFECNRLRKCIQIQDSMNHLRMRNG